MGCVVSSPADVSSNHRIVHNTEVVASSRPVLPAEGPQSAPETTKKKLTPNSSPAVVVPSPNGAGYLSLPSAASTPSLGTTGTVSSDGTATAPPLQMFRRPTIAGESSMPKVPASAMLSNDSNCVSPPHHGRQLPTFPATTTAAKGISTPPTTRLGSSSPIPATIAAEGSAALLEPHWSSSTDEPTSRSYNKGVVGGLRRSVAHSQPMHGGSSFHGSHSYGGNSVSLNGIPFAFSSSELGAGDERHTAPVNSLTSVRGHAMLEANRDGQASPFHRSLVGKAEGVASHNTLHSHRPAYSQCALTTQGSSTMLHHEGTTNSVDSISAANDTMDSSRSHRNSIGVVAAEKPAREGTFKRSPSSSHLAPLLPSGQSILHPSMNTISTTINSQNMQIVPSPTSRSAALAATTSLEMGSRSVSPQFGNLACHASATHPLAQRLRFAPAMQHSQRRSTSVVKEANFNSTSSTSMVGLEYSGASSPETASPQLSTTPSATTAHPSSSPAFVSALTSRRKGGHMLATTTTTIVPSPIVPFVEEIPEEDINEASISARMLKDADSSRAAELHAKYPDNALLIKRAQQMEETRRGSCMVSRRDSQLPQGSLHPLHPQFRGSVTGLSSTATSNSPAVAVAGQLNGVIISPSPSPNTPGLPLTIVGEMDGSPSRHRARASLLAFAEASDTSGRVTATSSSQSNSRVVSSDLPAVLTNPSVTSRRAASTTQPPPDLMPIVSQGGHSFDTRWNKARARPSLSIGSAFPTMQEGDMIPKALEVKPLPIAKTLAEASPLIARGPVALAAFGLQLPDPHSSPRGVPARRDRRHHQHAGKPSEISKEESDLHQLLGFEPINATSSHGWEAYGVATVESGSDSDEE